MKIKIIVLLVIVFPCYSYSQINNYQNTQTKYYQKVQAGNNHKAKINEVLMYTCQFVAGSADGVNQALVHHYLGMGNRFWDFQTSWKNKYKNYDKGDLRPAFPGATSIAVSFTDGYHLTRMIDRAFSLGSIGFALGEKQSFKSIAKKIIISSLVNRAGFLLFYNVIYPGNRAKRY
jgi:hypothetical protein